MCPLCHSKRVRRSRRRAFDFLFLLFRIKPMRCRSCSFRYYQWPWSKPDVPAPSTTPLEEGASLASLKLEKPSAVAAGSGNP